MSEFKVDRFPEMFAGNLFRNIREFAKINVSVTVAGFYICRSDGKVTGGICPYKQRNGKREVDIIPPQTIL
jgi:hypothetical protein